MAFNLSVLTTYSGTYASYFWLPATFGMDTVDKGVVYVQDGIKKTHTIGRIDYSNPLQPRVATPTGGASNVTIDGRALTPADVMIYSEFNPRDLEATYIAESLSKTLLDRRVPPMPENYILQIGLNRAFEQIENGIWMGSTTYTATPGSTGNGQLVFFDGFIKKMVADAAVLQVTAGSGSGQTTVVGTLTAAATSGSVTNVLDAMNALINLASVNKKALMARSNRFKRMKFICSVTTEQIYQTATTTGLTFKGQQTQSGETQPWKGFQVVACAGCPDDTIVFCEALADPTSNLYIGMNSVEDEALQLQKKQANSELFFLKGLLKFDVQYGFSEEVFLYTLLTTASFNA